MDMVFVIIGLGFLSWLIALMRGTGMDKFLLAGYNTASKEDRERMDQPKFIRNFKQFHFVLGAVVIGLGVSVYYFIDPDMGIMLSVITMLFGYVFFFLNAQKYGQASSSLSPKWAVGIMLVITIGVGSLFMYGIASNDLIITESGIDIDGIFGEELAAMDIQSVCVIEAFPSPKRRTKGFSLSKVKKGWYINSSGKNVKLIIEDVELSILHIRTVQGMDIYYQNDDIASADLQSQIIAQWPKVACEE